MFKYIAPRRFFASLALIALFVTWTLANLSFATQLFEKLQTDISNTLGWLVILAANGFLVFILYLGFSKFGKIRLGGANATPEFSFGSWIAMLFSAGLGIGLLFYGVAEPIMHLDSFPLTDETSFSSKAQKSMNLAFLHWGFHGWAVYGVVGLCFGISAYNLNKPFRISSMVENRLTQSKYGRVSIDVLAILTTIFGVATSLGLGATQINSGLNYLGLLEQSFFNKVWIIALITLLGLVSVVLGLKAGIKRLSEINIVLCICLLLIIFILGPTSFILNGLIQNIGSYLQNLLGLSTWSENYAGSAWQNDWTLFYYSWWFAWSPFVGLFIARVSYGRSIKEFVMGVVIVPALMVFVWMGTFGNAAIFLEYFGGINLSDAINEDISVSLFLFLQQFPFANFLMGASIIIILTFFVTSSDSGALVTSMLSASKESSQDEDPPMLPRVVWATSLGVVAAALLAGGGLGALQTSVLVTGVPFAIIIALGGWTLLKRLQILFIESKQRDTLS